MKSIIGKLLRQRYYIVQPLGRSSFSPAYLAEDRDFPPTTYCVIKIIQFEHSNQNLNPQSEQWENLRKAFIVEINKIKKLGKHPQIPQLLDYFEENWQFYLVQEFIEGETLEKIVEKGLLSETDAIQLLQDTLKVLDFVHQRGVIHQDIQPSNLIIRDRDRQICLIDFGEIKQISLKANTPLDETTTQIIGRLGYVPPEQKAGNPNFTSDLYALGKTVIYALSSKSPHKVNLQTIEFDTLTKNFSVDESQHTLTKISPRLTNILNKMVKQDYSERYQSAIEVLTELEREENVVYLPPPFLVNPPNEESVSQTPTVKSKQKKSKVFLWILLIIPFIAAIVTFAIGINRNRYRDFIEYTNANQDINNPYKIRIKYPKSWSIKPLEDPITGEIVVLSSPKESESDIFQEKIFITVENLPRGIETIEQYAGVLSGRIINNSKYKIIVYPYEEKKLDGRIAQNIVYSRQINGVDIRQLEVFTIDERQVFTVTYMAERAKYSKFLNTVNKIIQSLEIE